MDTFPHLDSCFYCIPLSTSSNIILSFFAISGFVHLFFALPFSEYTAITLQRGTTEITLYRDLKSSKVVFYMSVSFGILSIASIVGLFHSCLRAKWLLWLPILALAALSIASVFFISTSSSEHNEAQKKNEEILKQNYFSSDLNLQIQIRGVRTVACVIITFVSLYCLFVILSFFLEYENEVRRQFPELFPPTTIPTTPRPTRSPALPQQQYSPPYPQQIAPSPPPPPAPPPAPYAPVYPVAYPAPYPAPYAPSYPYPPAVYPYSQSYRGYMVPQPTTSKSTADPYKSDPNSVLVRQRTPNNEIPFVTAE